MGGWLHTNSLTTSANQLPWGNPAMSCYGRTWIQKSQYLEIYWHTMVPTSSGLVTEPAGSFFFFRKKKKKMKKERKKCLKWFCVAQHDKIIHGNIQLQRRGRFMSLSLKQSPLLWITFRSYTIIKVNSILESYEDEISFVESM